MIYDGIILRCNKLIVFFLIIFCPITGSSFSEHPQHVTVLILGDSLVQGYGLPEMDGFVPQLEKELIDKGLGIKLINGGVSGDTTAGGLARLDWSLTDDIDGVVLSLGANDMLRGLPPEHSKENLNNIIQKIQSRKLPVLLVGIRSIENYGKDYKYSFDSIFVELAKDFDIIYYPDFLSPILNLQRSQFMEYFQADNIHPNAKGVSLIVEGISPFVLKLVKLIKSYR